MRLIIFFLVFILSNIIVSQDNRLTNNDWKLNNLLIDNVNYPVNSINYITEDVVLSFVDNGSGYNYETRVCGNNQIITGDFNYPNPFSWQINSANQSPGNCCNLYYSGTNVIDPDCQDLENYSNLYFDFFEANFFPNTTALYIGRSNGVITLLISNNQGDLAMFTEVPTASTRDFSKKDIHLINNLESNELLLMGEDVSQIKSIKIYDLSGKLMTRVERHSNQISVLGNASGIYLMRIELEFQLITLKFIKS